MNDVSQLSNIESLLAYLEQGGGGSSSGSPGSFQPTGNGAYQNPGEFFASGGDFRDVLFGELGTIQEKADAHFDRTSNREDQLESFLDGIQGKYEDTRLSTQNPEDFASVKRAEQALKEFEDLTAQNMSAAASGLQQQFQGQMSMIQSGRRADGTLMSPSEQRASQHQLNQQIGISKQQALTPILNQNNTQRAQMGFQVAGLMSQAEQLNQRAEQINATNQISAMQLELQGRQGLAQYTMQNKESVVSVFRGLIDLAQMGFAFEDYRNASGAGLGWGFTIGDGLLNMQSDGVA